MKRPLSLHLQNRKWKTKKNEEKLETFLKTYGMMAVLTPKQFDELANQPLILPSRCPYLSRKRIKLTR